MTDQPGGDGRPTSYAEKYRGTEWGRPEPPPPPPSRGRRPLLIAVVAVVLIGTVGVVLAAFSMSPDRSSTASLVTHSPGLGAVDSTAATPTPSATSDPGKAVLAKFWTLVSAPDLSYQMTAKGKTTLDRKTYQTFSESFNVVGDDYSGSLKGIPKGPYLMGIEPSRIRSALVARKGGLVYLKERGSFRSVYRSSARADRLVPFMYIDLLGAIEYVKPVTIDGRLLHLLRTNRFYRPGIARMLDMGEFEGIPDNMGLDLYVSGDGVPVSGIFTMDVRFHDQLGGAHHLEGRSTYSFTSFGSLLKIVVPKR